VSEVLKNDDGFLNVNNEILISSKVVAEQLGRRHDDVVKFLLTKINDRTRSDIFLGDYQDSMNRCQKEILLTKRGFTLYMFSINGHDEFKLKYIDKFDKMERALRDIRYIKFSRKQQVEQMSILQDLLPEELKKDKIPYIKANMVSNKATSNYFGFPKMIKKGDMNIDMLELRDKILDDYLKLYDIAGTTDGLKEIIYNKYKQLSIKES